MNSASREAVPSGKTAVRPEDFYGPGRRTRVDREIRELSKYALEKAQLGVLAPPFQDFLLQQQAFEFADRHELAQDLRTFSKEMDSSGRRSFLVTSYEEFWRRYKSWHPSDRHFYEIIREGWPCHLYFDLEFKMEYNPELDGQLLVDLVVELASLVFQENFGLTLNNEYILEMDSSTEKKFSRHLVVLMPGTAFLSTNEAAKFVRKMCERLDEQQFTRLQVAKDDKGGKTTFIDTGVYTKNRAFRLMLSSKAGKDSFLQPTGRLRNIASLEQTFLESLVCNVPENATMLTVREDRQISTHASTSASKQRSPPAMAGYQVGPSPFPEVESFITSICCKGGKQGAVRNWKHCPESDTLIFTMMGNRWCDHINREHKSNGIYYVVHLKEQKFHQRCFDQDCRGRCATYTPLPPEVFWDLDGREGSRALNAEP